MRIMASAFVLAITASGAMAKDSGVTVIGDVGEQITLSSAKLYRALGDRIVNGSDAIGNNAIYWSQIDPTLPRTPIKVTLLDDADEMNLTRSVRQGCISAGGSARACDRVRLRTSLLDRDGFLWQSAVLSPGMARFDPSTAIYAVAPTPPPAPPSVPKYVSPAPVSTPAPSVVVPAYQPTIITQPMIETAPDRVYATRMFLGRDSFPPEAFAAYGILAFQTLSTSEDKAQYIAICEAFFSALLNTGDVAADKSEQMVTVWPIDDRTNPDLTDMLNTTRAGEDSCENAVEFYDIQIARGAIGDAKAAGVALSGRGPFLLAWAPAGTKGQSDAVVLATDLSDVKSVADAKDVLTIWRDDIESDPALWQGGFSVEKLRVKLRQIVNRYGEGMLKFLGG